MADVFISYAREDKARADQVAHALQSAGYDVFWDSVIPPGQTWSDFIEAKLGVCKAVIVLWSEASTKSQWVREEARMGREKGKLIPARIDAAATPFGFGEVQTADLSTWRGETEHREWQRLLEAVRGATGAPSQPAAAQPQPQAQPQTGWAPASGPAIPPPFAADNAGTAQVIYILYLASIVAGITAIIGLVMAYIYKDKGPDWLESHHVFLIHTFWIGLLYSVVSMLFLFVGIGFLMLVGVLVWWIVRCVQGLNYLSQRQPIPAPRSWLLANKPPRLKRRGLLKERGTCAGRPGAASGGIMADIFVSYAREDKARAEQVARGLEAMGLDVFWDSEIRRGRLGPITSKTNCPSAKR
ncbi:MAG: TIR domain-containing protein [Terricaulis sp.]